MSATADQDILFAFRQSLADSSCKGTVHFQHRLRHGVATPAVAAQHRLRHGHATPAVAAQLRLHLRITSSSSASLRSLSLPTVQSFLDRKSTRLNSSHLGISYAVFCLKKNKHRT